MKTKTKISIWATIFHISYVQILYNEPLNEIRGTVESICDEFLKNVILWKHEASAETISQIDIISHSFEQIEQLNTSQNSWISKFILYHLQSLRCFS